MQSVLYRRGSNGDLSSTQGPVHVADQFDTSVHGYPLCILYYILYRRGSNGDLSSTQGLVQYDTSAQGRGYPLCILYYILYRRGSNGDLSSTQGLAHVVDHQCMDTHYVYCIIYCIGEGVTETSVQHRDWRMW